MPVDDLCMCCLVQTQFEKLSRTKIKKKKTEESVPLERVLQRHAGVLGLSACVQAFPYDVPEFVPDILMTLSNHVNDPQPIQVGHLVTTGQLRIKKNSSHTLTPK